MSRTFSIACRDCREGLWIAQASAGKGHVYGTREHLDALYQFLMKHQEHALVFDENCESEIGDFSEFEADSTGSGEGLNPVESEGGDDRACLDLYGAGPEIPPATYWMGYEGNYVCLVNERPGITLDGHFSIEELRHFLKLMENPVESEGGEG